MFGFLLLIFKMGFNLLGGKNLETFHYAIIVCAGTFFATVGVLMVAEN